MARIWTNAERFLIYTPNGFQIHFVSVKTITRAMFPCVAPNFKAFPQSKRTKCDRVALKIRKIELKKIYQILKIPPLTGLKIQENLVVQEILSDIVRQLLKSV